MIHNVQIAHLIVKHAANVSKVTTFPAKFAFQQEKIAFNIVIPRVLAAFANMDGDQLTAGVLNALAPIRDMLIAKLLMTNVLN